MSVRTNRFLTSTCLGFLAFPLFLIPSPVFAGFEWTPPERQVAAPLPKSSSTQDFSSESSGLPEVGDVEISEEPAHQVIEDVQPPRTDGRLKVKVITPHDEASTQERGLDYNGSVAEPVVMSAPLVPKSEGVEAAPEPFPITETHQGTGTVMPEPAESVYEPANKEPPPGLNINPYPLEEEDHTEPALTAAPAQPEEITWKGGAFDVIEGFGSDMPLALALRQVVPAQYAFSFGRGVNPGYLVSWEGGKPWNLVLDDMLRPLNIKALIQGNVVKVVSGAAPVAPAPEPVPVAEDSAALAPLPEAAPLETPEAEVLPVKADKKAEKLSKKEAEKLAKKAKVLEEKADEETAVEAAVAEEPVKVASAPETAPEPQIKKAPGRNVILDPGDVKAPVADEAQKAEKSDEEEIEEVILAKADEPAPPADDALKAAKAEETEKPAPSSRSNEQLFQPRIWEAKQGSSLKETLDSWSKQANVPLQWNAEKDYTLSSNILISGTFDNTVKVLFAQAIKNGPSHNLKTGSDAALVIDEAASG